MTLKHSQQSTQNKYTLKSRKSLTEKYFCSNNESCLRGTKQRDTESRVWFSSLLPCRIPRFSSFISNLLIYPIKKSRRNVLIYMQLVFFHTRTNTVGRKEWSQSQTPGQESSVECRPPRGTRGEGRRLRCVITTS